MHSSIHMPTPTLTRRTALDGCKPKKMQRSSRFDRLTTKSIGSGTENASMIAFQIFRSVVRFHRIFCLGHVFVFFFWIADVGEMIGFVSTHFVWVVKSNSIRDSTSGYMERLYRGDVRPAMVIKMDGEDLSRNLSTPPLPFLSSNCYPSVSCVQRLIGRTAKQNKCMHFGAPRLLAETTDSDRNKKATQTQEK